MPLKLFRRAPGGAWYIRGTIAGQRLYESTGCLQKSAADAWRMRREQEISERHSRGPAATFTFAAAALAYIEAGGETRFLRPILEYFGPALRLDDLDNAALVRAAAAIYPHAAPATINRQLITPVSAIVTMAAEDGRAQYRKFRRLKGARARTRWLTPLEMDRFLDQAGAHLVPILAAMVGTGQ